MSSSETNTEFSQGLGDTMWTKTDKQMKIGIMLAGNSGRPAGASQRTNRNSKDLFSREPYKTQEESGVELARHSQVQLVGPQMTSTKPPSWEMGIWLPIWEMAMAI